jgi:hypothetical protein
MQNYYAQTNVTETITSNYGTEVVVSPMALAHFKHAVESHLIGLTSEIQTLKNHVSWIEPRLNDFHKFMEWMQRVHPDVITAYTEATKVEKVLDRANNEMIYPQAAAA